MIRIQRGSEEISAFRGLGKTNPRLALAAVSYTHLDVYKRQSHSSVQAILLLTRRYPLRGIVTTWH